MNEMTIGDLRQRLTLELHARTDDGGGGAGDVWISLGDLWAAVKPLSGTERVQADAIAGGVTHEVWLRYRADVVPEMRFRKDDRLFDIRAVLDVEERRTFLRCFVEERDL